MSEIFILLLIGLAAGLLSGLLGIGGGIIIIPMLVGFLGYTQKDAQGTSLGLLLLPIGILAVMNYYKAGYINVKAVGIMVITFVIGSYLSSKYVTSLPDAVLKKIFAVFLLLYAFKLLFGK
ncbi:MAG: permease [Stygiobacter sp. RIFOXYC12_FULL_38_8]|nr:MAG: permease [Stygiobacter sp. GWC2_38_9]OGU81033.1 MAG: permease [Stygiobacter sp. RIFOXYA12_FULL_38_9]OGV08541.1 MAG: permease [Stygiobacter sp. RIFOXYB2_FULL_37_11]OGV09991.1 MAG: permease [Stygiobacter sp. RIFOXYA2_FULL_38_8]OGV12572.1 MAG: permease [Stygiobacter sp. RIFOXYC2_FULL_38_25]OGV30014.1 MAG: permease [Stygiobacter sp. RIFOXYC12_FULL_38_8]OGV78837.1 MAG: permease [Stygiobacter sp. GWF2_38_21]RJQ58380.1 MAG: sulfite exporter TauE/SafE family protein [Stygiobacter sp.]